MLPIGSMAKDIQPKGKLAYEYQVKDRNAVLSRYDIAGLAGTGNGIQQVCRHLSRLEDTGARTNRHKPVDQPQLHTGRLPQRSRYSVCTGGRVPVA